MKKSILIVVSVCFLCIFSSCVQFMAFQSPKVLIPDKHQMGFGLVNVPVYNVPELGNFGVLSNFHYRRGLKKNIDAGIKVISPLNIINLSQNIIIFQIDYKHQLIYKPDFSYSIGFAVPHNEDGFGDVLFTPMAIFGYKNIYIGNQFLLDIKDKNVGRTMFIGYEFNISERIRFRPEMNFVYDEAQYPLKSYGLAIEINH